ncbi:Uncharacterised protein [Vibrio cholerae]|uniref:Uncharacterized protein n=1 Tax=Vibrio cholerae TaxID=666 RepID=A0A656AVJ2_VIBCL|nr:Uncharacterised protein [Vibrio cholerae]
MNKFMSDSGDHNLAIHPIRQHHLTRFVLEANRLLNRVALCVLTGNSQRVRFPFLQRREHYRVLKAESTFRLLTPRQLHLVIGWASDEGNRGQLRTRVGSISQGDYNIIQRLDWCSITDRYG